MEARECAGTAKGGAAPPAFGAKVPYGDPAWYQEHISPYYKDSHHRFRAAMRQFVDKEVRHIERIALWHASRGLMLHSGDAALFRLG